MNIENLSAHLKAKDILQKNEALSLAFDNFKDIPGLKKLGLFIYSNRCANAISFKSNELAFQTSSKYKRLFNEDESSAELDQLYQALYNEGGQQIFIGKYDDHYVFIDLTNCYVIMVKEEFLKKYIEELLILSNLSLLDRDFKEMKDEFQNADFNDFEVYEVVKMIVLKA